MGVGSVIILYKSSFITQYGTTVITQAVYLYDLNDFIA